jgi:hypothetical protein
MVEEKKRVTLQDVVGVLAKHSATPTDPDDAETLNRFNEQAAEEQAKSADASAQKGRS